jgi:hypothetical protein
MSSIQCALHCKLCGKYSAHPIDYVVCIVVPAIYNVITAPHIQSSIYNWACLRCCWRYIDNSMRLKLKTLYQIQRTSTSLRCMDSDPGHIQCNYSSTYLSFNSQLNVSPPLLEICRVLNAPYTANIVPNTAHILQITQCEMWSRPYTL